MSDAPHAVPHAAGFSAGLSAAPHAVPHAAGCLRSAPVRMENFRSKREYVFVPVCIGALFCMHMTAGPDFTGLCFVVGAAEQEASESRTVKRKEGPEVAEAREGRGSQNRE